MQLITKETKGVEVYDEGGWQVDLVQLEKYLNTVLTNRSFGKSVETFYYGFELFDFGGQFADFLGKMKGHSSYRPKMKAVVINDQIDFRVVKHESQITQLKIVIQSILASIARVGQMKRKPKDFDFEAFYKEVQNALHRYISKLKENPKG